MQQQLNVYLTRHANCRVRQRGLKDEDLNLIATFADHELRASGGCEYWAIGSEGKHTLTFTSTTVLLRTNLSECAMSATMRSGCPG